MANTKLVDAVEDAGGKLVTRDEDAGAVTGWDGVQWESDGTEDIAPSFPIIKIVQRTSNMDGAAKHIGQFWHSDRDATEAFNEEVQVVALVKRNTRALFEAEQDKPSCMSADGNEPLRDQPLWQKQVATFQDTVMPIRELQQPTRCTQCPFAQWDNKTNEPPRCKESKMLLVERDDGSLAQLRISGMNIRPFEQFVARYLKPKHLPLYSKRLTFTTASRSKPGKVWEELEIYAEPLSVQEGQHYAAILREQRERFEETIRDEAHVEWGDENMTAFDEDTGEIIEPDTYDRGVPFE